MAKPEIMRKILFTPRVILKTMRPKQWTKNLIIFAGIIFSLNLFKPFLLVKTFLAFILFCLLSGIVYIINDIRDLEKDKNHPLKSKRPLASGELQVSSAILTLVVLIPGSLLASFLLSTSFGYIAILYLILSTLYSFYFKHTVILDVLIVSIGFVLRAVAGTTVINVVISPWLFICTILLALFLGLGKRRHELVLLGEDALNHRKSLEEYSPELLDQMIAVVTASTVMAYSLYTMAPETREKLHTPYMNLTIPFVIYGIFRYLYLIHKRDEGGDPSSILLSDKPMLVDVILWMLTTIFLIYHAH
jgi:4-hydroxybenzoate polyprenyltransferase